MKLSFQLGFISVMSVGDLRQREPALRLLVGSRTTAAVTYENLHLNHIPSLALTDAKDDAKDEAARAIRKI